MSGYNTGGREPANGSRSGGNPDAGRTGGGGGIGGGAATPYGAPIHTNQYGSFAESPKTWDTTKQKVDTYNTAAQKWNASANTPSLANLVNNMAPGGFSMQAPDYNHPKTYVGGDYHLGLNPAALAGGMLGMYGSGMVTGPLLGKAYTQFGGQNVMLGGGKVPDSWANPTGPMTGPPGSSPTQTAGTFGNTGGGLPGFPMTPATPFGQQPTPTGLPRPQPPVSPGQPAFPGGVPNHSLPQGYDSLFPNSLTAQDKALLYGKALTGGGIPGITQGMA